MRLVLHGILDEGTECELAARLGVSPRHLRRLFLEHVGATPDQLARFRRSQCARRLLDDTDLPVTQIAFAAGYGSLRQLNRSIQQVFRASPTQLRAGQRADDGFAARGDLTLRLPYRGQLDWAALRHCLAAEAIPGIEQVSACGYRRTVVVDGAPGIVELRPGGPGHLVLVAHLPRWEGLVHVVGRARRIAGLDQDPGIPARSLSHDALIGPLLKARPGVRVPGCWNPFEVGVRAIIGQHERAAAATGMWRLVHRLGTRVPGPGRTGLSHCFPSAEAVASAGADGLAALGLGPGTATAIAGFAAALTSGQLDLDRYAGCDQLISSLTAIGGLGAKCAHYIALRAGEPDAFPAPDLAIRQATATPGPPRPIGSAGDDWRPWRAFAATHLWLASQPELKYPGGDRFPKPPPTRTAGAPYG